MDVEISKCFQHGTIDAYKIIDKNNLIPKFNFFSKKTNDTIFHLHFFMFSFICCQFY